METQGNGDAKTETNGGDRWVRKGGSVEMEEGRDSEKKQKMERGSELEIPNL